MLLALLVFVGKGGATLLKGQVKVAVENDQRSPFFSLVSDILYPGNDRAKQERLSKLWQDYYDCQSALYEASLRLFVPKALAVHEGGHIV